MRENIRHGRGKSFEIECPRGFSGIDAGEWTRFHLKGGE